MYGCCIADIDVGCYRNANVSVKYNSVAIRRNMGARPPSEAKNPCIAVTKYCNAKDNWPQALK